MRFRVTALTASGELARQVIEAADEPAAVAVLRRQNQIPMRIEPEKSGFFAGLLDLPFLREITLWALALASLIPVFQRMRIVYRQTLDNPALDS